MMLRSLVAGCLALTPMSAAVPKTTQPLEAIPLVLCPSGFMLTAGSAFRIGPHLLLSVAHVTSNQNCLIDGEPIHVVYSSGSADFSMLSDNRAGKWLKVDCNGFVPGRQYVAIGHARASENLSGVSLIATGEYAGGEAILTGISEVQPGMSGGAVIDHETNMVVGTINAANWEDGLSFSVALRDTPLCKGHGA